MVDQQSASRQTGTGPAEDREGWAAVVDAVIRVAALVVDRLALDVCVEVDEARVVVVRDDLIVLEALGTAGKLRAG